MNPQSKNSRRRWKLIFQGVNRKYFHECVGDEWEAYEKAQSILKNNEANGNPSVLLNIKEIRGELVKNHSQG